MGLAPVAIRHWPLDRRILLGAGSGAGAGTGTGAGAAAGAGALLVDCWVASREERSLLDVDVLLLDLLLLDLLTERQHSGLNLGMAGRQASKREHQQTTTNFYLRHITNFLPYHLCKSLLKNPALSLQISKDIYLGSIFDADPVGKIVQKDN